MYTFKLNFISKQAFNHLFLSCHSGPLKVRVCRELRAPVHLSQTGSDCCESFFCALGGCGKVQHNKRNYDFESVLEMAGDQNTLEILRADPDPETALRFRRHEKTEWFLDKDENQSTPDAALDQYPSALLHRIITIL